MVCRVSRLSPPSPPPSVIQLQFHSQLTSEVAHDALVYYCKMLGLAWLGFVVLGCWRTSTSWKECALTAPVGEGHAISSYIYRHEPSQTFALFYLHTLASSLAATPGVSMIITILMMMWLERKIGIWEGGDGGVAEDIGMHKIYRLKLSQRLEAFKNDMSESERPPPPSLLVCYHNHYYYVYFVLLCSGRS